MKAFASDCTLPDAEIWNNSTIESRNAKGCFPTHQFFKVWTVPKRWSGSHKAHVLITYTISASFATLLVRTKTLWFPLMQKIARYVCEKPQWTGNSPACPHFQILGAFTPLIQSFIPMNKTTSSVKAQMAVKHNGPLFSNASCYEWCPLPILAEQMVPRVSASKLKHSQGMVQTSFQLCFHNEGYT